MYERALDVDHRNTTLWLKYAESEMRNRHVNQARNVWDRAVTLMPRVDQFWFKFVYMEEMLGNVSGARAVVDRWVEWEPDAHAWAAYVRRELRRNQPDRARGVYERWVACHNFPPAWVKWAKFESGRVGRASHAPSSSVRAGAGRARPHGGLLPGVRVVRGARQGGRARARRLQVRPRRPPQVKAASCTRVCPV